MPMLLLKFERKGPEKFVLGLILDSFVRDVKKSHSVMPAKAGIQFIKICQNTPQLCWGDEWPPLSPGGRGLG